MNILFLCVGNSARSQMAEGLAKSLFGNSVFVESAGSIPKTLNPMAVEVMKEIGLDISKYYAKSYDKLPLKFIVKTDYIISLCAEETCPDMASRTAKRLTWAMPDPAGHENLPKEEQLQLFRTARDSIKTKIIDFKNEQSL